MEWKFNTDMPIYSQLVKTLQSAIASGSIAPGERLPAVRELALEAAVNPNTVQRAFQELERLGLVYALRANGRYVTEDPQVIASAKEHLAQEKTANYLQEMRLLGYERPAVLQRIREMKEENKNGDL